MCIYTYIYIYINIWDFVASTDGQCSAPEHPQQYPQQQPAPLLDDSQVIHNQTIPSHPKHTPSQYQDNSKPAQTDTTPAMPQVSHTHPSPSKGISNHQNRSQIIMIIRIRIETTLNHYQNRLSSDSFVSDMGVVLIWYAVLDSKCNLASDCMSQNFSYLILTFQCFCHLVSGL